MNLWDASRSVPVYREKKLSKLPVVQMNAAANIINPGARKILHFTNST